MKFLRDWVFEDFRSSGVPDRLTIANVRPIEGDEALEVMTESAIAQVQRVNSYVTRPAAKILQRYNFVRAGGWLAYGCALDGSPANSPYFKPVQPRKEFKNGRLKPIKYETAQGTEATPILPFVDDETAQGIYRRYGVTPLEGETFWIVVYRCGLPLAITEGLKKALALIAHGIPAIALRGIACWHKKGTDELHQAIAQFATPGRTTHVIFDQDEKVSTQIDVRRQILRFGSVLANLGCKVSVPVWDGAIGKGIDDALVGKGEDAQEWFNSVLQQSPSLNDFRRHGRLEAAMRTIANFNRLTYPVERETEGEYLPELPQIEPGAIHVLDAGMNAGKTTRIGADWVKSAIARGWNVLVLSPLNALGRQTANNWGLPHIHGTGTLTDQQHLWSRVSNDHGVVMCPDSLHRVPDWFWQRPTLLVLDEANQAIEHMVAGDTLGTRWADILERFSAAALHSIETGAIVLSEDGIPDRAVKFIETITGCGRFKIFRHIRKGQPWDCTVHSGQASGFRARFLHRVGSGHRLLFLTSSQREARRIERALLKKYPGRKVVRIDSETNEKGAFGDFFGDPDPWLQTHQPDVLILSPSAKSGVSIEGGILPENAYFESVWAYFPSLATDTHAQLLGRYRPAVPRFIFAPPFIRAGGDESLMNPRAIARRLQTNLRGVAGVYGVQDLLEADDNRAETLLSIETAVTDYLVVSKAVKGSQMSIACTALVTRLEKAGHSVKTENLGKNSDIVQFWKDIQEELWVEDAQAIAAATPTPEMSEQWAHETLNSIDCCRENRILANKVLWRAEFPGITFDDVKQVYESLCKDWGALRRGVILQAKAENLEAAKEADRDTVEAILKGKVRAFHRLPKTYLRSLLIAKTGVLDLLTETSYTNTNPKALRVKEKALYWANEINYYLRLTINSDQTPVEISNKLLKKIGLEAVAIARPGKRGEKRDKVWSISEAINNPVRLGLLKAIQSKLSGSVSPICKDRERTLQIEDTPKKTSLTTPECLQDIGKMVGLVGLEEVGKLFPPDVVKMAIAFTQTPQVEGMAIA